MASITSSAPASASATVARVAHRATLDHGRLEPVEHAPREVVARLGALERLGARVVQRDLVARAREHRAHARAHGPGAHDRDGPERRSCVDPPPYPSRVPILAGSPDASPHALRRDGQLRDGHARVRDGGRDGPDDPGEGTLAAALGPERARAVAVLDDDARRARRAGPRVFGMRYSSRSSFTQQPVARTPSPRTARCRCPASWRPRPGAPRAGG